MTDQKVKKRGWVKNAAIIFLAVMLVLTFFSNTIMKHSLPEVAAQYVQSGTISAKIRGTGTVAANESYDVKSEQAREVLSVPVKVGDQIKVGDTLLLYSDAESSQLKEAQAALDTLLLAYQKALINENSADYEKENRAIELTKKALEKAKAERDTYTVVSAADIAAAKINADKAKTDVSDAQTKVDNLTAQLETLTAPTDNSAAISSKISQINDKQADMDAAMLVHKTGYDNLTSCATKWRNSIFPESDRKNIGVYKEALASKYALLIKGTLKATPADDGIPALADGLTYDIPTLTAMVNAYNAINPLETSLATYQSELAALYSSGSGSWNYYSVKTELADAKKKLTTLQNALTKYQDKQKELEDAKTKFDAAQTAVDSAQKSLEDQMFDLAEKKKTDGKTQASEALDLAAQRKQIEQKEEDLADLKKGGAGAKVESKVNGIVAAINVTAGKTAEANAVLMTIEVPDMGYGISFAVTTEQSKKVALGDTAEVSNYYGGDPITATLVNIKSDPQNPGTKKLLTFKIQGEVESGTQLSLALGERGGNYETIVPNSSIRSDNNGKFVLAIVAKSSPLGNRYIATRIDVQVLATDDVNSAVSGGITTSDMVITTSTKPIEPGTQVRLADQ